MQSLKENFFVKTSYAYFNLFKKLYFFILFLIIMKSFRVTGITGPVSGLHPGVDFFNLFSEFPQYFHPNPATAYISIFVIFSNILVFALSYMIIFYLDKFLKNVYEDNPFIPDNGKHLKSVGTVILILALFLNLKIIIMKLSVQWVPDWTNILLTVILFLNIFFSPYFIIGLFTFTLGEIIIRGSKLKEEIELTV